MDEDLPTGAGRTEKSAPERERTRIEAIFDAAIDAVITIDEHGVIQSANPAVERLFAYPPADLVGRNVSMLMPSPHRERHDQYLAHYLRTGEAKVIGMGRELEPEFTNEVQHQLRVLQWANDTASSALKSAARLPGYARPAIRSARSLQLWVARHRASLGS